MKLSDILAALALCLSVFTVSSANADAPHLTSVTQPLYFKGSVAGDEIQPMSVPKIFNAVEAEFMVMLYMSPTIIDGADDDMNLISAYGIKVRTIELHPNGALKEVAVDVSKAKKPEGYPFSVEQAALSAVKAIRKDMKGGETKVRLVNGDKVLPLADEA